MINVPNLNSVVIAGRATRDAELKVTEGGNPYLRVSMANNANYKDKAQKWQEKVTFINATLWGKGAEYLDGKIKKGSPIIIEGKLSSYSKQVGDYKQTILSVDAYKIQLLERGEKTEYTEPVEENEVPQPTSKDNEELPF